MIQVAIAGLGRMGISHFAIANMNPDVKIQAVCDPSGFVRNVFEKHSDVKSYKDIDVMLDSENLDAIFITTPTNSHYKLTRKSIDAGLHVFVEKPFCIYPEEGKELVDLVEKKNIVNQVGYHNRFLETFNEARRLIRNNSIGRIINVFGEVYGPVILRPTKKTWRTDRNNGGGCLYDYAAHIVNLMQFVNGYAAEITGAVLRSIYSQEADDAVYAMFNFENGATGQIHANWSDETFRKMTTRLTISGELGKLSVDAQEMKIYFKREPSDQSYQKGWNVKRLTDLTTDIQYYLRGEEYSKQINYFFDCIKREEKENISSFREALATDILLSEIRSVSNEVRG